MISRFTVQTVKL